MNKKLENYYNYIVEDLISGTELNYARSIIYYPFLPGPDLFNPPLRLLSPPSYLISKYLKEKYALRDKEVGIVWDIYSEKIIAQFNVGRGKYLELLNYIVEDLISDTEIDWDNDYINAPFLYPPNKNFPKEFYFDLFSPSFTPHIKEKYGTRDEEVETIWSAYIRRIQSLIINEKRIQSLIKK